MAKARVIIRIARLTKCGSSCAHVTNKFSISMIPARGVERERGAAGNKTAPAGPRAAPDYTIKSPKPAGGNNMIGPAARVLCTHAYIWVAAVANIKRTISK